MLRFLWCLSCRQKLQEHSIKSRGDFERVVNKITRIGIAARGKFDNISYTQLAVAISMK